MLEFRVLSQKLDLTLQVMEALESIDLACKGNSRDT
jgi:hypothetical protein